MSQVKGRRNRSHAFYFNFFIESNSLHCFKHLLYIFDSSKIDLVLVTRYNVYIYILMKKYYDNKLLTV